MHHDSETWTLLLGSAWCSVSQMLSLALTRSWLWSQSDLQEA